MFPTLTLQNLLVFNSSHLLFQFICILNKNPKK
jgi:hypothetical protein